MYWTVNEIPSMQLGMYYWAINEIPSMQLDV